MKSDDKTALDESNAGRSRIKCIKNRRECIKGSRVEGGRLRVRCFIAGPR